jgi:hypothetical protein
MNKGKLVIGKLDLAGVVTWSIFRIVDGKITADGGAGPFHSEQQALRWLRA